MKTIELEALLELKEYQRMEWANMCIKKQREIERLKEIIDHLLETTMPEVSCIKFKKENDLY